MSNESDPCRGFALPKLYAVGWGAFTNGRIVVVGARVRRRKRKRADYLLSRIRGFTIARVEADAAYKSAGDGPQQAKDYVGMLVINSYTGRPIRLRRDFQNAALGEQI